MRLVRSLISAALLLALLAIPALPALAAPVDESSWFEGVSGLWSQILQWWNSSFGDLEPVWALSGSGPDPDGAPR
ncbi:MAG TPA: hypothetical protein PK413_01390 [Thermoanaerobaculia bacterium]|nr:hypothetical protein [Thermoanaerobaculia bacterium]